MTPSAVLIWTVLVFYPDRVVTEVHEHPMETMQTCEEVKKIILEGHAPGADIRCEANA